MIGVLGGMGPAATADFYAKLVRATPAVTDQGHVRTLIWSDPTIPDRTAALIASGPDPLPLLVAGARRLQDAGAAFIVMPCNTAHAFLGRVRERVEVPFLHMVDETCRYVLDRLAVARVGLLATTATVRAGLYQDALEAAGVTVLAPDPGAQTQVMDAIARVKAGSTGVETRALIHQASTTLVERGAQAVIAGCTELPIALAGACVPVPVVDPAEVLADAAVAYAMADRD